MFFESRCVANSAAIVSAISHVHWRRWNRLRQLFSGLSVCHTVRCAVSMFGIIIPADHIVQRPRHSNLPLSDLESCELSKTWKLCWLGMTPQAIVLQNTLPYSRSLTEYVCLLITCASFQHHENVPAETETARNTGEFGFLWILRTNGLRCHRHAHAHDALTVIPK